MGGYNGNIAYRAQGTLRNSSRCRSRSPCRQLRKPPLALKNDTSFFEGRCLCARERCRENRVRRGEGRWLCQFFRRGWRFWRVFGGLGFRQSLQRKRFWWCIATIQ